MPYVFKVKHSYVPPDENGLVETIPFLKASGEILVLIGSSIATHCVFIR